jgi:biotin carboxylase
MAKDIILFVNAIRPVMFSALRAYEEQTGRSFTPVVLVDQKIQASITERNGQKTHAGKLTVISADFDSPASVREALRLYEDRIFAVTCQYENSVLELKKLVPYFPYLPMPSEKSLDWATEKKLMREMLEAYDPSLVPKYMEVSDSSPAALERIKGHMTYPLIVKPSGLEGSLLVSMVNNARELTLTLDYTFQEIQKAYDTWIKRQKTAVLVEEFMKGDMYSVDVYVAQDGTCYPTPPVKVITGQKVGFDDFFGYMRLLPSGLDEAESAAAQETAERATHALGLRAVTAHVELMRTASGWKIIELGPRIGGYRHAMYNLAYGINHLMNDARNRAGEVPDIPTKLLRHTAVFNIYARQEGMVESIDNVEMLRALPSFVSVRQVIGFGEEARFAKNNGDPVLEVTLSHASREQLDADIDRMERDVQIHVRPLQAERATETALQHAA